MHQYIFSILKSQSHIVLHSLLFLASSTLCAQESAHPDYAPPAFRSPVVAIEFTGQRCRYCPNLSRSLKGSQDKYGKENYIITALHNMKEYSLLPSNHVSLYHPEAEVYAASIDVHQGLPQLAYNSLGPTIDDHLLEDMFKQDDVLECKGSVWTNDKNELAVNIHTRLRSNMIDQMTGKQTDILLWILENDIVALQDDNGKFTYPAHQHIFRGSVNGIWGTPYDIGTNYSGTFSIPEAVSAIHNSEMVVLFLDHDTKNILDAATLSITQAPPTGISTISGHSSDVLYDFSGRRITEPNHGQPYIKNGKKHTAR